MTLIERSAPISLAENTPKPVCRLGSAWTRWGAYSSSPHPLAALKDWDAGRKRRGKGGDEGKRGKGKGGGKGRELKRDRN